MAGSDLIRNVFVDRLRPDNRLPFPPPEAGVQVMLALVGLAVIFLLRDALTRRDRSSLATALLALGLLPQMLQRTDRDHVLFVGVCVVPLALASLLANLERPGRPRAEWLLPAVSAGVCARPPGRYASRSDSG